MRLWAAVLIFGALQLATLSPRQLVRLARPLQPPEVNAVLGASREAITNRTFVLSYLGQNDGLQILMREDGWPRFVRGEGGLRGGVVGGPPGTPATITEWSDYFIHISEYTGAPARRCDGSTAPGELVITYTHARSTDTWTARAGTKGGVPICNPVFDVLAGRLPTVSDETTQMDGQTVRGFTARFSCASGTYGLGESPTQASQTVFIDADSLLPVRWQVAIGPKVTDTRVLIYKPLDLRPPDGVEAPQCIQ